MHNRKPSIFKGLKSTFLITNKCTILVGSLAMAHKGLRGGGVRCSPVQVGVMVLYCYDFLLERHLVARDGSQGGGSFVGKQS